jgi:hypothetical protein
MRDLGLKREWRVANSDEGNPPGRSPTVRSTKPGERRHPWCSGHGGIKEFAQELACVTGRFLKAKAWADSDTERIMVGGGFRGSRAGVAQRLSEVRFMQDVEHWGVLTIGTGSGNARFTSRKKDNDKEKDEKKDEDRDKAKDKKSKD